jgi:cytochrome c553
MGRAARRWRAAMAAASLGAASLAAPGAAAFEDTMAQRVKACTGCHGQQGRAASDGYYPRIAGKPAGYLYNQLLSFRAGRRHYALMTQLLTPLSDAYLLEIAEHFAQLRLGYPAPQPPVADPEVLRRGERLVREGDTQRQVPACVACHDASLMGVQPAIPALIGLPRDYLNAQLGAWRTGNRHAIEPDCMAKVAVRLDAADVSAVSQWLAAQPVPAHAEPAERAGVARPLPCGSARPDASTPAAPP